MFQKNSTHNKTDSTAMTVSLKRKQLISGSFMRLIGHTNFYVQFLSPHLTVRTHLNSNSLVAYNLIALYEI